MFNINLLNKPGKQIKGMDEKLIFSDIKFDEDCKNKEVELTPTKKNFNNNFKFSIIILLLVIIVIAYYYFEVL